jgi:hypothetical protein
MLLLCFFKFTLAYIYNLPVLAVSETNSLTSSVSTVLYMATTSFSSDPSDFTLFFLFQGVRKD